MKRIIALLLAAASFPFALHAQVSVTATQGTAGPTNYTTLNLAFAAINAGTHKGAIDISITSNVTETASASLLASASPSSYTSISIKPSGGAARTITGVIAGALIDLNGADNVTIDGLNSNGNSLTISNTSAANTANISTVRMINGATGNSVTNCTLLGSFSGNVSSNPGGTVLIATGSSGTGGNSNNTISNNNIGPAGSNLPTKAVNGNGSTSAVNTGNTISNNNIYDYFGAGVTHSGIYLNGSNSAWTISGNRFYQTATRTITSGIQTSAIWIIGSSNGYTISNNIIGYASAAGTGTYTFGGSTASADFIPLYLQCGDGTNTISGNTITAISASAGFSGTGSSSPLKMIFITTSASNADIVMSDNTIGSNTATGAIALNTTSSSTMDVFGIYMNAVKTATLTNNKVGGISLTIPGNSGTKIIAINFNNTSGTITCQGNTIGGTVANSLNNTSNSASSQTIGIMSTGGGTFSGNTISNLSGNGGSGSSSIITGIYCTGTGAATITQNTISAIAHLGTSGTGSIVSAIQFDGGSTVDVSRNKIYNISSGAAQTTTVSVNGIYANGGTTVNISNNFIGDIKAPAASVIDAVRGITLNSSTASTSANVYFNTIYLSGTSSATNFGSAAVYHRSNATATTAALTLRNNILINATTPKGTGFAVALRRVGTNLENYNSASNNNLFYAGTPGTANLIYYDGTNSDQTLAAFKARVNPRESASITGNPNFLSTTGSNSNFLRINTTEPTSIESGAAPITGFTLDYDGQTRNASTPDMGADEFTGTACAVAISPAGPLCFSSGPLLTSSSATSFNQWNLGGVALNGATNSSYQTLAAGSYTVSIIAPTCAVTSAAVLVYAQSAAPGILNSSAPAAVCAGTNVILTQTGGTLGDGAQWQWYSDAAFTQAVGSPTSAANAQITVAPTTNTTYYLRAEGGLSPCAAIVSGSATVSISIRTPLSAAITARQPIQCQTGQAATLDITAGPANGSVTVTTGGVNPQTVTLDASGAAVFTSGPLSANTTAFTITSVSDNVCTTPTSITATVYTGTLIPDPNPNQSVCTGLTVPATAFHGNFPAGTTYSWTSTNPAIGLAQTSGSGLALPSFTATNSGTTIIYSDISVWPNLNVEGCEVRKMVFRISVKPTPSVNASGNQVVCAGAQTAPVIFSGNMAGTVYNWSNSEPSIGIAALGSGDLPTFTALNNSVQSSLVATFTVTPYNDGCVGAASNFAITVNKAAVSINYMANPYCPTGIATPRRAGASTGTYSAPAGIVFNNTTTGEINLGASQPGTYTVTFTVSNTGGGCGGSTTASITILPRATVNIIPNQALCANNMTTMVQPSGTASGFSWVNLNPAVGLTASGTGAIPAFTALNNTAGNVTAQINVTPLGNGTSVCNGNPVAYRYLVYPRPVVNTVTVPDYCRGVLTAPVAFSSATTGTSYAWTNNNVTIGLAASGTSGLPAFTASNPLAPGNVNTATITVTPSANKCAGSPYVFQVSVLDCIAQSGATGTGDNARMASVQVGPNPASSTLTIALNPAAAGSYSVQLLTTYGTPVARARFFSGSTYSMDLSGITPGTYVLQLVNQRTKQSIQKQVIKL